MHDCDVLLAKYHPLPNFELEMKFKMQHALLDKLHNVKSINHFVLTIINYLVELSPIVLYSTLKMHSYV